MQVFTCPRCGLVRQFGRADLPVINITELCYMCTQREGTGNTRTEKDIERHLRYLDDKHGAHSVFRHGRQTSLDWHKKRLETSSLFGSTKYASFALQNKALGDILRALQSSPRLRQMMDENRSIVIVAEHGRPVDEGYYHTPNGIEAINNLTRSKAFFKAGQYDHPYTYYPTWQGSDSFMIYPNKYPSLEFYLNQLSAYVEEKFTTVGNLGDQQEWHAQLISELERMKSTGEQNQVIADLRKISQEDFFQLAQVALGVRLTNSESVSLKKQLLNEWSI